MVTLYCIIIISTPNLLYFYSDRSLRIPYNPSNSPIQSNLDNLNHMHFEKCEFELQLQVTIVEVKFNYFSNTNYNSTKLTFQNIFILEILLGTIAFEFRTRFLQVNSLRQLLYMKCN